MMSNRNDIAPEKVREMLDNLNSCFADPAISQEEARKEFDVYYEYIKAFSATSKDIAEAYLVKCEEFEAYKNDACKNAFAAGNRLGEEIKENQRLRDALTQLRRSMSLDDECYKIVVEALEGSS